MLTDPHALVALPPSALCRGPRIGDLATRPLRKLVSTTCLPASFVDEAHLRRRQLMLTADRRLVASGEELSCGRLLVGGHRPSASGLGIFLAIKSIEAHKKYRSPPLFVSCAVSSLTRSPRAMTADLSHFFTESHVM